MRVFLSLCVLVATTVAHPCSDCASPCPCPCEIPTPPCDISYDSSSSSTTTTSSSSTSVTVTTEAKFVTDKTIYPPYIPPSWNIVTFTSACATQAFQKEWYVTMSSPISCLCDQIPLRTGIFYNCWPSSNIRWFFEDTTPECTKDFNIDYYMLDTSFNLITQQVEKSRALLRAAYGRECPLAVFTLCAEAYYPSKIDALEKLIDAKLSKHPCDDIFTTDITMACIGADENWSDYMVLVFVDKIKSLFGANDNHFIVVLTRKQFPEWHTYEKAFSDIKASGLSPYCLMSVDHSVDLKSIPTLKPEDIDCVIDTSLYTTTTTKSLTTTTTVDSNVPACIDLPDVPCMDVPDVPCMDVPDVPCMDVPCMDVPDVPCAPPSTVDSCSTTVSTIEIVKKPDYKCPYDIEVYPLCGNIKVLMHLTPETIREILSDTWYLNSGTPCLLAEIENANFGLLNNAFPCCSPQVMFPDMSACSWDGIHGVPMLERAYDACTGKVKQVRSIVGPADSNVAAFVVYTEGCYLKPITKVKEITPDGCVFECPGSLYIDSYTVYVVGYRQGLYTIWYIPASYKNLFCNEKDEGLLFVLTRERVVSAQTVAEINQQILLCGFNPYNLISIDQYMVIEDKFVFDDSYFQYKYSTTSVTVEKSCTVTSSCDC